MQCGDLAEDIHCGVVWVEGHMRSVPDKEHFIISCLTLLPLGIIAVFSGFHHAAEYKVSTVVARGHLCCLQEPLREPHNTTLSKVCSGIHFLWKILRFKWMAN